MRLSKERVHLISSTLVKRLLNLGAMEVKGSPEALVQSLDAVITEELSVEDRLNAEVKEMLKQFESEFETGRADFQKTFSMIKSKIVRERGIIL